MLKTNFKAETSSTQPDSMQSSQPSGSKQSKQQDRQTFHKKTLEKHNVTDVGTHKGIICSSVQLEKLEMCNQCIKKGHYAGVCKAKKKLGAHVAAVTEEYSDEEDGNE